MAFKHKHIEGLYCDILETTSKGYKVLTVLEKTKGRDKVKQEYFNEIDFSKDKGVWLIMNMKIGSPEFILKWNELKGIQKEEERKKEVKTNQGLLF